MVRMFWLASKFITVSLSVITDVLLDGVAYTYIRNFKSVALSFTTQNMHLRGAR